MEIGQSLYPHPERSRCDIQQVSAMLAIIGQKVEMITGNAEGAGEDGRPKSDQRPGDVLEDELRLCLRSVDQARAGAGRVDGTGSHAIEVPIKPNRVEDVPGLSVLSALCFQFFEASHMRRQGIDVRLEPRHDCKGSPSIGGCCRHAPGALDPIDVPIEYDHLAVEVGKCAKPKVAMV